MSGRRPIDPAAKAISNDHQHRNDTQEFQTGISYIAFGDTHFLIETKPTFAVALDFYALYRELPRNTANQIIECIFSAPQFYGFCHLNCFTNLNTIFSNSSLNPSKLFSLVSPPDIICTKSDGILRLSNITLYSRLLFILIEATLKLPKK